MQTVTVDLASYQRESDRLAAMETRVEELEAAVLAAKVLLEPTTEATEDAWQVLYDAYHRQAK